MRDRGGDRGREEKEGDERWKRKGMRGGKGRGREVEGGRGETGRDGVGLCNNRGWRVG